MNKKVLLGFTSALVLASSAFGYQGYQNMPPMQKQCPQMQGQGMQGQGMQGQGMPQGNMRMSHHKDRFMATVMRMDLTNDQRTKIREIIQESMKKFKDPMSAFSEKGFDKALFVKLSKEMRDERATNRADVMEKVYNLLDDSQKKEFLKRIKERPMMKQRNFNAPMQNNNAPMQNGPMQDGPQERNDD